MRLLLALEREMSILYFYSFAKSGLWLARELMQFISGIRSVHGSRVGACLNVFAPFRHAVGLCLSTARAGLYSIIKTESA